MVLFLPHRRRTHNGPRASSLHPFKEFANREEDTGKRDRTRRKGRNKHDSSRNYNYADYIFRYVYIYNIYIYSDVYVRVRDQTLHCHLNKMRSHVNKSKNLTINLRKPEQTVYCMCVSMMVRIFDKYKSWWINKPLRTIREKSGRDMDKYHFVEMLGICDTKMR